MPWRRGGSVENGDGGAKPRIVHLSRDFPDPIDPNKTQAILRLVEATADSFDHLVLSLNRVRPGISDFIGWTGHRREGETTAFEHGLAVTYRAPPRGLFHAGALERMGEWLAELIAEQSSQRPALLIGHKLTIEGLAVRRAADLLRVPYAICLQGNTDGLIIGARPDLASHYADVLHGAAVVFPFSPWALEFAERRLGPLQRGVQMLPCMIELDVPLAPRPGGRGFVTAFHLRNWKTKNFDRIVAAHRRFTSSGHDVPLAVIGGGDDPASQRCRAIGARAQGIVFEGPMAAQALPERLNQAVAFVMPSRRESFGMAFIEALFAGLPIIYPAGQAVDGYFDECPFALRVEPRSTRAIAAAMAHAIENERKMKAALREWQQSPQARRFSRPAIAAAFTAGLQEVLQTVR